MGCASIGQIVFKLNKKMCLILLLWVCVIYESIISDALMLESKELMSGKILRVVILHVSYELEFNSISIVYFSNLNFIFL